MASTGKVLIVGGYGTFGTRLARLLLDVPGVNVVIGGRSLHKAARCAQSLRNSSVSAVHFDRDADVAEQLKTIRPDIVIDASGPFQAYGESPYRVAIAALSNDADYIDLADSSDFVANIESLDRQATAAGRYAIAGASTCPALTMAVARNLIRDLQSVERIRAGIALSPRAQVGKSVVRAIATYAGKAATLIRNGRQQNVHTFTETCRFAIAPPGKRPLPPLTFSLIDVPDLVVLGTLPVPVRETWFGVSTRPAMFHALLRLLSHAVKAGLLPGLKLLAPLMHKATNSLGWGEHRSGMFVEVRGTTANGVQCRRSWHLLAPGDDGPSVPTIAAAAIVARHVAGAKPAAGARSAASEIEFADFAPFFDKLGIRYGERHDTLDARLPVFRSVLGSAWEQLPDTVRRLHATSVATEFHGTADITGASNLLAQLAGRIAGLPHPGKNVALRLRITPGHNVESWEREFAGRCFRSRLSSGSGRYASLLVEQIGPVRLAMALVPDGARLRYVPCRWSFLGIPMPRQLMPSGDIYETQRDGRFVFHVEIRVPVIGHLVTYRGSIKVG